MTYGYISDIHERKAAHDGLHHGDRTRRRHAVGPGDSCYVSTAQAYDEAFAKFFQRLAADGITPANTEFVISAEENDQFAGANVGRHIQPTPAGCDGVTVACHYTTGQIGELSVNINGQLAGTQSANTAFSIEPQGASIYVGGNPAPDNPSVRQLERDTAAMTADDPYTGVAGEKIVNFQADRIGQRILHMQTADALRTPTFTLFPKPDYYFGTTGPNLSINPRYAYNHGYYSPNIDITWVGMAGPGVAERGIDGPAPQAGINRTTPTRRTRCRRHRRTERGSRRSTCGRRCCYLVGLHDDYTTDGVVVVQALAHPGPLARTEGSRSAISTAELQHGSVCHRRADRRLLRTRERLGRPRRHLHPYHRRPDPPRRRPRRRRRAAPSSVDRHRRRSSPRRLAGRRGTLDAGGGASDREGRHQLMSDDLITAGPARSRSVSLEGFASCSDLRVTCLRAPVSPGVQLHDLLMVNLSGPGTIDHVINNTGAPVSAANPDMPSQVVTYPTRSTQPPTPLEIALRPCRQPPPPRQLPNLTGRPYLSRSVELARRFRIPPSWPGTTSCRGDSIGSIPAASAIVDPANDPAAAGSARCRPWDCCGGSTERSPPGLGRGRPAPGE